MAPPVVRVIPPSARNFRHESGEGKNGSFAARNSQKRRREEYEDSYELEPHKSPFGSQGHDHADMAGYHEIPPKHTNRMFIADRLPQVSHSRTSHANRITKDEDREAFNPTTRRSRIPRDEFTEDFTTLDQTPHTFSNRSHMSQPSGRDYSFTDSANELFQVPPIQPHPSINAIRAEHNVAHLRVPRLDDDSSHTRNTSQFGSSHPHHKSNSSLNALSFVNKPYNEQNIPLTTSRHFSNRTSNQRVASMQFHTSTPFGQTRFNNPLLSSSSSHRVSLPHQTPFGHSMNRLPVQSSATGLPTPAESARLQGQTPRANANPLRFGARSSRGLTTSSKLYGPRRRLIR